MEISLVLLYFILLFLGCIKAQSLAIQLGEQKRIKLYDEVVRKMGRDPFMTPYQFYSQQLLKRLVPSLSYASRWDHGYVHQLIYKVRQ